MTPTLQYMIQRAGDSASVRSVAGLALLLFTSVGVASGQGPADSNEARTGRWETFSELSLWDDGLSEMSYYDARDTLYGVHRKFTRVHLMNRQWMGRSTGVKCDPKDPDGAAVFKFVITEQIPTENYNYRYLTTAFVTRPGLTPFKITLSSQEWCGTTFKHLRWTDAGVKMQSFSYFGKEGDRQWDLSADNVPFESVFLLARAAGACGKGRALALLPSLRSNHAVEPEPSNVVLRVADETKPLRVRAGRFVCKRVSVTGDGHDHWFDVEAEPPYRLIAFSAGGVEGKLISVERRAYWDRQSRSKFYARNKAP